MTDRVVIDPKSGPPPFPKKLKSAMGTFTIERASQARLDQLYTGEGSAPIGVTNENDMVIAILDSLNYQQKRLTLFHEILHVGFSEAVPHGWHLDKLLADDDPEGFEEFIVSGFELPLLNLFRNNPKLVAYFMWKGDE